MGLKQKRFGVSGMTCSGCERRVEKVLSGFPGVVSVQADYRSHSVTVEGEPALWVPGEWSTLLEKSGYHLAGEKTQQVQWGKMILILAASGLIAFAGSMTGLFTAVPDITQGMGLGMLFAAGLLTSMHCVAMCGGLVISQNIREQNKGSMFARLQPGLLYNGGRVAAYTLVGALAGGLGSVIRFPGPARGLIALLAGLWMLVIGLGLLGVFPGVARLMPALPAPVRRLLGHAGAGKSPLVVGLVSGLMPCGPLQAMQLYALGTGSIAAGAASMCVFALGTVPLMLGLGGLSALISRKTGRLLTQAGSVLVIVFGLVMLMRGVALSGGMVQGISGGTPPVPSAAEKADVQVIRAKITSRSYPQITVQAGRPVRLVLTAETKDLNGCNSTLLIPAFNVQKKLKAGENIIEFTPESAGTIPYSCWMGMIRSQIKVQEGP